MMPSDLLGIDRCTGVSQDIGVSYLVGNCRSLGYHLYPNKVGFLPFFFPFIRCA
jgi:hypothetical protein